MAITKIREVPSELPHAHLYLDDVEDICRILIESYKKRWGSPGVEPEEPAIVFSTGDLRMDSIEDLEKLGGSAKKFTIEVGEHGDCTLRIYGFLNPELRMYSESDQEQWAIYSRIKTIFEHRQYPIKNGVLALPKWIRWSLWALLMATPGVLFPRIRQHPIMEVGAFLIPFGLLLYNMFRPSRVSLVRYTERSKIRAEWKSNLGRLLWLVLGVLIGTIVPKVVEHFLPALKK